MFSSATQPRHNFVVSAITFEGFKLHSSNLTHALLIQISRTSLIIDIVVPSKMVKKKVAYLSEMVSIGDAIESYLRTSKMTAVGHFVKNKKKFRMDLKWPEIASKVNFGHPKWPINLKWPEMRSKVNFGQPK